MANNILLNLDDSDGKIDFSAIINGALKEAQLELEQLDETIGLLNKLGPDCDKLDYMIAAGSGALCGIVDIFLVGMPNQSFLGDIADIWVEDRTKDFAKLCGWKGESSSSAIRFLETTFKIPYDQRGAGDKASVITGITPKNHHFKSLGHNPSVLGLFYSIMNQFTGSSHFISEGRLIVLVEEENHFELIGNNHVAKLFCGMVNWFGHLLSDVSGASGSKGRGTGIPSPLWTWINDIIVIKEKLAISPSQIDKQIYELANELFVKGFDIRFQTAQTIPVILNELCVRFFYSFRRFVSCLSKRENKENAMRKFWESCEPFSNPTVKRMLTIAHGTFCLVDLGDAVVRSLVTGPFHSIEFLLRVNLVGIGRFTISLYGEVKRESSTGRIIKKQRVLIQEKTFIENYIEGLKTLADEYDDQLLVDFVNDLSSSDLYVETFDKSKEWAQKRHVPKKRVLGTKSDIDNYFMGE